MCYSFESSVKAYIVALATMYVMYQRGLKYDKYMIPLIATYSLMQVAEAMMWKDLKCGSMNMNGTHLAYISLYSHVLAIGLGIYNVNKQNVPLIMGVLLLLYGIKNYPKMECSQPKNGNMNWGFNPSFYSIVYALSMISMYMYWDVPISYKIIGILFYSLSGYYFIMRKEGNVKRKIGSSLWCHFASLFSICLYFIPNYF